MPEHPVPARTEVAHDPAWGASPSVSNFRRPVEEKPVPSPGSPSKRPYCTLSRGHSARGCKVSSETAFFEGMACPGPASGFALRRDRLRSKPLNTVSWWPGFANGYAVATSLRNPVSKRSWWRRWESNPRPRNFDRRYLRAQPAENISPCGESTGNLPHGQPEISRSPLTGVTATQPI